MLSLDDSRWAQLNHAYGSASDIPALLQTLAQSPGPRDNYQGEPWFSLWSALCHQGDAYTASYAAAPHIVRIAADASMPIDSSFFLLPASIEVARWSNRAPPIPADLADSYRQGLAGLMDCASIHRAAPWDKSMVIAVAAAQAVAKGQPRVAEALMNLDDDLIDKINRQDWD